MGGGKVFRHDADAKMWAAERFRQPKGNSPEPYSKARSWQLLGPKLRGPDGMLRIHPLLGFQAGFPARGSSSPASSRGHVHSDLVAGLSPLTVAGQRRFLRTSHLSRNASGT